MKMNKEGVGYLDSIILSAMGMYKMDEKIKVELEADSVRVLRRMFERKIREIRDECDHNEKIRRMPKPMTTDYQCIRCGEEINGDELAEARKEDRIVNG